MFVQQRLRHQKVVLLVLHVLLGAGEMRMLSGDLLLRSSKLTCAVLAVISMVMR